MTCEGCTNPNSGIYIADCRGCSIRDLARGPLFFASMRAGVLTPEYRASLLALGSDVEATHRDVKAAAKQYTYGAIPA